MQLRIESSQRKKFIEQSSHVRQIEMKFLDKESSRQYSQVMEEIMKTNLRKESHRSLSRQRSSNKSLHKESESSPKSRLVIPAGDGHSEKEKKVEIVSQEKVVEEEAKKIPYKFSIKSLGMQVVIGYAVTFALLYFIRLGNFPYFQMLLIIALTLSIDPWQSSNVLMLIAIPIVIGNYFLGLGFFSYPSILICYYAVLAFNERHKRKQLFVFTVLFTIVMGLLAFPAIYQSRPGAYIYIFPVLMLILRIVVNYCYWIIGDSAIIFLQLPLFLTGLQYGTILSQDPSKIEFWYLLVFFTLQIVNDRTQFLLRVLTSLTNSCSRRSEKQEQVKGKGKLPPVLPAQANGYACINSFHLFIIVYIYGKLGLFTAPYNQLSSLLSYVEPWYKPIIVWLLTSVYEIMSIVLQKNSKDRLLFGYTSNRWWRSILRGFMLALGMWIFYLGLGVGALLFPIPL